MSGYIGTQPVPQATQTRDSFTATSGQTSFATGGYTPNFLDVYLNGVKLASADYTATNGSDVVLASGASTGDILEVVAFTTFNSASSSIDDNGNATAITIDSSENVLVGKTTIATGTAGIALRSNGEVRGTANGDYAARFSRLSSDGAIVGFEKDGAAVGSIGADSGYLTIGDASCRLLFLDSTPSIIPRGATNAGSDGAISLGDSGSRFKDAYLSGGVYLGGTGSANKLDDYEEGTWTPSLYAVTGGAITVSANTTGYYTKVGRLVHVSFALDSIAVSGGTGGATINIAGLPFTTQGSGVDSNGSVLGSYNISWSRTDFVALRTYDVETLGFLVSNNGGTWIWETVSAFTGSNKFVNGTITYMTTA